MPLLSPPELKAAIEHGTQGDPAAIRKLISHYQTQRIYTPKAVNDLETWYKRAGEVGDVELAYQAADYFFRSNKGQAVLKYHENKYFYPIPFVIKCLNYAATQGHTSAAEMLTTMFAQFPVLKVKFNEERAATSSSSSTTSAARITATLSSATPAMATTASVSITVSTQPTAATPTSMAESAATHGSFAAATTSPAIPLISSSPVVNANVSGLSR